MTREEVKAAPGMDLVYPCLGGMVHYIQQRPLMHLTHGFTACGLHVLPVRMERGQSRVTCSRCLKYLGQAKRILASTKE